MSQKYISNNNSEANSFGGGDVVIDVLQKQGIVSYLDSYLGPRPARAEYTYGEGIISWFICQLGGGKRIENLKNTSGALRRHPRFSKGMSPDTLLYMCKKLANSSPQYRNKKLNEELEEKIRRGKSQATHEFDTISKFNELLIDFSMKLGLLKPGISYTLDFDTTEIINKIEHSRRFYKGNGKKAYCPAVAMINNIPVYIENRNGDSNSSFKLTETVGSVLDLLKSKV